MQNIRSNKTLQLVLGVLVLCFLVHAPVQHSSCLLPNCILLCITLEIAVSNACCIPPHKIWLKKYHNLLIWFNRCRSCSFRLPSCKKNYLGSVHSLLCNELLISLPKMVKPSLPAPFTSRMDGVSISRFVQ